MVEEAHQVLRVSTKRTRNRTEDIEDATPPRVQTMLRLARFWLGKESRPPEFWPRSRGKFVRRGGGCEDDLGGHRKLTGRRFFCGPDREASRPAKPHCECGPER